MIQNNPNLPYNLRVSQNEVLLEFKPDGETFNLHKLTKGDACALAELLYGWSGPHPTVSPIPAPASIEEIARLERVANEIARELSEAQIALDNHGVPINGEDGISLLSVADRIRFWPSTASNPVTDTPLPAGASIPDADSGDETEPITEENPS